jgi:predicted GIY-YIG superfamily endonuclease
MGSYWVYMVKCSDGSLYTGSTNNLARRLATHNRGKGSRYTRSRLPVTLAYKELAKNRKIALKREFELKRLSRKSKDLLCSSYARRHISSSR